MLENNLKKIKKNKKRLGRGNTNGNTCGRGNKGAKSRSGYSRNLFEGGQTPFYKTTSKIGFKSLKKKIPNVKNFYFKLNAIN
ncbi:hypothetical protein [Candidatus Vidania fulgoroideorum]